jgi:hypothetical protein
VSFTLLFSTCQYTIKATNVCTVAITHCHYYFALHQHTLLQQALTEPVQMWLRSLHDSVRDDRYLRGLQLQNHPDAQSRMHAHAVVYDTDDDTAKSTTATAFGNSKCSSTSTLQQQQQRKHSEDYGTGAAAVSDSNSAFGADFGTELLPAARQASLSM